MNLIFAAFYKEIINKKRYLLNTIFSMIMFCVIFALLILGAVTVAGDNSPLQFGSSTGGIVVAYYAWTMMLSVYTSTGYIVEQNKQNGTLENIMSHTKHITSLLICESIVSSMIYFMFSWIIIGFISWISGIHIHFMILDVFLTMMIGLISILGVSLITAGFTLLFRKTDGIMSILQFALLGLLFLPKSSVSMVVAPFFTANQMLTDIFLQGTSIFSFQVENIVFLVLNSAIYLALGILVFKLCLSRTRVLGTLSFY